MQSWQHMGHKLDSIYWQAKKVFWQTIWPLRGRSFHTARCIKGRLGVLLNNEVILGRWGEIPKPF